VPIGGIALEILRAARPVWWLETLIDVLAVVVAHTQYGTHWRRLKDTDASARFLPASTPTGAHA
jgi:hypothetical protein